MAERMIIDYTQAHPTFSSVILRYFNVIGADPLGTLLSFCLLERILGAQGFYLMLLGH